MKTLNRLGRETIKATDETIREIVKSEIERLGNEADLNHIDVSEVTNMICLFEGIDFKGDISKWKIRSQKKLANMYKSYRKKERKWFEKFNERINRPPKDKPKIEEPVNDTPTPKEDDSNTQRKQFFVDIHIFPMRIHLPIDSEDDTDNDNDTN